MIFLDDGAVVNGRTKLNLFFPLFFWKTTELIFVPFTPAPSYVCTDPTDITIQGFESHSILSRNYSVRVSISIAGLPRVLSFLPLLTQLMI